MATLSARGAHKVVAHVFEDTDPQFKSSDDERVEVTYALRSDGTVLCKTTFTRVYQHAGRHTSGGNYSIVGKFKDRENMRHSFDKWLERKVIPKYGPAIRTH